MERSKNKHLKLYLVFGLVAVAGIFAHLQLWNTNQRIKQEDIYYLYVEGSRLVEGVNPYERVLVGDMRKNEKYATYFPMFYLLSGCTQLLGLKSFGHWLAFWKMVFLGFNLGICYLIFKVCADKEQSLLGIFGALFWLFNRWTLNVTIIAHIDFLPLFFLLLSLSLLPRCFSLACLLFGLSLAIKQIAIFALPVYLIWSWRTNPQDRLKHILVTFSLIVAIPLLSSIPFLIWNSEAYVKSILFSATRYPVGHFKAPSLDALAGFYGIPSKIPMLFLMGLAYMLVFLKRVPLYASHLLVMTVFFCFNSVLFRQYTIWFLPFIPLTIGEIFSARNETTQKANSEPNANLLLKSDADYAALHLRL
jgi:hypothetical protein